MAGVAVEVLEGAKEKEGAAGLVGSVEEEAGAGVVVGTLNFGASEAVALLALLDPADGTKPNDGAVAAVCFSGTLDVVGPEVVLNGIRADGAEGTALFASAKPSACCRARIFDMAAASRSCFSHFEYDLDF